MINTAETRNNYNANNNNKSVAIITEADNKKKTDSNINKDASLDISRTYTTRNTSSTRNPPPPTPPTPTTQITTTTTNTTTTTSSSTTSSSTTPTTILSCSYDEIDDTEDAIMKLIQHGISVEAGYLKDLLNDDMILMMNNNNNVMNVIVNAKAAATATATTTTTTLLLRSNCAGENDNDRPLVRLIDDSIHDNKATASLVEATTTNTTTMTNTAMTTTNTPSITTILLPFIDWNKKMLMMFANDESRIVITTQAIVEGWITVLNQMNEISSNDVIYYYSQQIYDRLASIVLGYVSSSSLLSLSSSSSSSSSSLVVDQHSANLDFLIVCSNAYT